jgi:hypothetical protein
MVVSSNVVSFVQLIESGQLTR